MATNSMNVTRQIIWALVAAGMLWALLGCGPAAIPPDGAPSSTPFTAKYAEPTATLESTAARTEEPNEGSGDGSESTDESGMEDSAPESTTEPESQPTSTPSIVGCVILPEPFQSDPELHDLQVKRDGIKYQCFPPPEPTPTSKYPEIGEPFSRMAASGEEAREQANGASGASGQSAVDLPTIRMGINFKDSKAKQAVVAWLQENGVPYREDLSEGNVGYIFAGGEDWVDLELPTHMLPDLMQLDDFGTAIYPLPANNEE